MAKAVLKKGEGRYLKRGGLWIYDNEIAQVIGDYTNGEIVDVEDFDGDFMGKGYINNNSVIRIRMMTRRKGDAVDRALIDERVERAVTYRWDVMGEDVNSCRLIFGEADYLPGITVDKFEDILVVESLTLGIENYKADIVDSLIKALERRGLKVRGVYERSDAKERIKEGLERCKGFIGSKFDTMVPITENGVKYMVNVEDGQKTGFFLDQKYNRRAVAKLCKGKTVLDCFTHTGSFALNAACAGAEHVTAVDASQLAIDQAKDNAALNNVTDIMDFICADVFDLLPALVGEGKKYDVVILDPPAFAKSRGSVKNATKGYREINMQGLRLVRDGGFFATCSCSHFMTQELFTKMIGEAARMTHKRLRQVEFRTQAPDHPILWAADESYYLKFYIFQVVDE